MLIFSYGSNMLMQKLKVNVPSARKISNACLKEYRFAFNKVSRKDGSAKGNIWWTGNETDNVWGVVFEIDGHDKKALDREEGLGKGYSEISVSLITAENKIVEAFVYIADTEAIRNNLLPLDWYRDMVMIGAMQNRLPESYINDLEKLTFIRDDDEGRRNEKYKIITAVD